MHGTGRRYGENGKTLGAALKHILKLLEQKNDLLFLAHQYWESKLRPYVFKTSLNKRLNFCQENMKNSKFKLLYREGDWDNSSR